MRHATKLLALAAAGALLLSGCGTSQQEAASPSVAPPSGTTQPAQTGVLSLASDPQQSFHPITGTNGVNVEL